MKNRQTKDGNPRVYYRMRKQDGKNHLKDQFNIAGEDDIQEITAAKTPGKKNSLLCVTYNQNFNLKDGLKKHIQGEHTELLWNYCGKVFRNRKEKDNCMYEACWSSCHEGPSKDEVDNYKEDIVVEKEKFIIKSSR